MKTSLSNVQKLVQTRIPTFTEVDTFTKQALLAGKLNLRDNGLRDRFAGRRQKTQVHKPWVFSHQPPDDENRDENGVAPPCNYSIHQLIDTGGDFDHLQSQLPNEVKFILGGNDYKGKECMMPGAVRFIRGFTARMLAILDFRLKIFPVENHWLSTLTKTLREEHDGLTPAQQAVNPHLTMVAEIEKVQSTLLFANGMAIEEMIDLAKFFKLEKGKTLHDIVTLEKLHRKKIKTRPVKPKETLLNNSEKDSVQAPIVKKTVEKECWLAAQNLTSKVLGWNSSLTFGPNMQKHMKKKRIGDKPTSLKRPRDNRNFERNTRSKGKQRETRRDKDRKRAKRKAEAEKKRKAKDSG